MDARRVLLSLLLLIWWTVPVDAMAGCTQDIYYVVVNPAHIKYDSECSSKSESLQMCAEIATSHGYDPSAYCGVVYTDRMGPTAYGGWFMQQKDVTKVPFHFAESTYEVPRVKPYRNAGKPDCDEQCFGDPVNSGTGNKFEHRIEYKGQGAYPLEVSWTYNSQFVEYYHTPATFIFGPNRTHFYGRSLTRLDSPSASIVFVSQPDGNAIRFEKVGDVWVGPEGHGFALVEFPAGGAVGWEMTNEEAGVESYDAAGRLLELRNRDGRIQRLAYLAAGLLQAVESDDGRKLTFEYNASKLVSRINLPDGTNLGFRYSNQKYLSEVTYADGAAITYHYNEPGYVGSTAYPALTGIVDESGIRYSTTRYDNVNRALSRITDGSGDTQYCYDRFGHLVRKVQATSGQAHTVRYAYTQAGQLAAIEYPDGTIADYIRDVLGRTTEIGITRPGNLREVLLTSAGYYPFGPAAEWVFGKDRLIQRTLNQNYQPGIVQDQNSGALSLGYEFDPVGNLIKIRTGDQGEPPLRSYGYDALNRLIEARDGASDALLHAYTYDPTGNRASATEGGTTTPYTIAPYSHHLLAIGSEARTYDPNGNTTAIGTARTFVYNDSNRMAEAINNGQAATYAYNGKGEQVLRRSGGADTVFLHDEAGHWLGEYDSSGQPVQQVVWLDDLPVGLIVGPAAANEPLHYIEADALGTPRVVIESKRNVAVWEWRLTGEAFGKDDPIEDADGDGTSMTFNMRFPGQRYDPAMGLNYNYYRDYEAEKGRYAESDPIGLKGGYSTYAYATSTPLEVVDRSGLFGFDASCNAAQRAFITSQIVALANEINQRIQEQSVKCFTHDCDMKLIEDAMDFIARDAWYSCDGAEGGCGGQAARYQIFSPGYLSNPPEPESLTDPNEGCGCVRAALFHEAAHAVRPLHSESQIRRETRSCLTCAPNVDENGVPLW